MSGTADEIEWYLARDGEQFGPLSDAELKKIIELGHLRPSDLIWRSGMEDWQEAEQVFAVEAPQPDGAPADAAAATDEPDAATHAGDDADHQSKGGETGTPTQAETADPAPDPAEKPIAAKPLVAEPLVAKPLVAGPAGVPATPQDLEPRADPPAAGRDFKKTLEGPAQAAARGDVSAPAIGQPEPPAEAQPQAQPHPQPQAQSQHLGKSAAGPAIQVPHQPGKAQHGSTAAPGLHGQLRRPAPAQRPPQNAGQPHSPAGLQSPPQPLAPSPQAAAPYPQAGTPPPAAAKPAAKSKTGRHIAVVMGLALVIGGISWAAYNKDLWIAPKTGELIQDSANVSSPVDASGNAVAGSSEIAAAADPVITAPGAGQASPAQRNKLVLLAPPQRARLNKDAEGTGEPAQANPLQSSALWRFIEKEFPRSYAKRAAEAEQLKDELPDDHAIIRSMAVKLVALRRTHASEALASSRERLRAIATGFLKTVEVLAKHSVNACYGFISHGEFSPEVSPLMKSPEYSQHLDAQNLAVLEAAVEGKRQPQSYSAPKPVDYRALGAELTSRGWSNADLQLFTDPVALSNAPPEKVCKMVQEWFGAQLALPDSDAQTRLLVQSLRPVIAG